jgi:hypothetical protein
VPEAQKRRRQPQSKLPATQKRRRRKQNKVREAVDGVFYFAALCRKKRNAVFSSPHFAGKKETPFFPRRTLRGNKKRRRHLAALCGKTKNAVFSSPHFAGKQKTPSPPRRTLPTDKKRRRRLAALCTGKKIRRFQSVCI